MGLHVVGFLVLQCCRQSGWAHTDSDTCSALEIGSGGPVSDVAPLIGRRGFRSWMRLSPNYLLVFGPCSALREVWAAVAPPPVSGMDRRSGFGSVILDKGPSAWLHSLSHEQAINAARRLHRDAFLMMTNLNILDPKNLCAVPLGYDV